MILLSLGQRTTEYSVVKSTALTQLSDRVFISNEPMAHDAYDIKPTCEVTLIREPDLISRHCSFENVSSVEPYVRLDTSCWLASAQKRNRRFLIA
jgi:hypothetical protein